MPRLTNLLAWRHQRRRGRLRFWAGMTVITLAAIMALSGLRWQAWQLLRVQASAGRFAHQQRMSAVMQLIHQRQERQVQHQHLQQRQQLQAAALARGQRWQQRLTRLAAIMPQQAWLTGLSAREGALTLSGMSQTLQGVTQLEQGLSQVGFRHYQVGRVQHDAGGNWQFSFRLYQDAATSANEGHGHASAG